MAFSRNFEKKGMSLPGLIDIIFLLLIFSLVTISVSQAKMEQKSKGETNVEFQLPEMTARVTEEIESSVRTILFQIENQNPRDNSSPKIVYVLRPSLHRPLSFEEAKRAAIQDSLFAVFPDRFLELSDRSFENLPACRLIRSSLKRYKEANFFEPDLSNSVEIRAFKNTEFRIFNFILTQCSAYGDTIPQVVLHTLGGREGRSEL